ncbi:hypothetical protein BCV71DRAFT_260770 [Rhizopus microsporus]|uniref:Phosphatidate phosphatase APP1 catalytic domain-containing protein n=1 Tax=Rhizopus microsporus TaxID=58291 RepID=A0A1X0SCD1_RHIZD|nr:hypothetical protein BCV71DRAFT_260770 [Rhizopus microsporus]
MREYSIDYVTSKATRECILFPTYAKRNPKNKDEWIVKAKGWALSHNCSYAKQKVMMGITKSVAGKITADQLSLQAFEQRFKYFLATNQRHKKFVIQAIGIISNLHDEERLIFDQSYLIPSLIHPTSKQDDDIMSRPSNPISSILDQLEERKSMDLFNDHQSIQLKTTSSGFFLGEFSLSHAHILNWARAYNQCDARLIRIQSISIDSKKKCITTHGIANLVEPLGISIISDIDDTIKDTKILAGARTVLSKTFFEPPQDVHGMADAYMSWYTQGASFHYVSNSPFQLIPMLYQFIRDSHFPPGSMHLRDEASLLSRLVEIPGQAKREAILEIIHDFPQRQFVLVGDSGEIDLEIYTRIAVEFPNRILKIFIRDVTTPLAQEKKKKQQRPSQLSSIFYSKRPSQSFFSSSNRAMTDDVLFVRQHRSTPATINTRGSNSPAKVRPFGMRRAMTDAFAHYTMEPHLTGHKSQNVQDDASTTEACTRLYERIEKARQQIPNIDVILFQDANVLRNDEDIQNALWGIWDNARHNPSNQ